MAPSEKIEYQARAVHDLIAGTQPDQMHNLTPCAKWDTRALMNHLVGGATALGAAFKGEPVDIDFTAMPDMLGDDPVAAWDAAMTSFMEGVDSPGAMEREVQSPMGPLPGALLLEILTVDVLVHAWDLATATGQTFDPPAELVAAALEAAQGMIPPEARDGDVFAAEVTPPPDATQIDRLAAFTGRAV